MTGQNTSQNATLFVMTSEIRNAPNLGFTQAGGFTAVTVRNTDQWYGLGYGAVASATPNSAPNTVPNSNGLPTAGYAIYNAEANLASGSVSNSNSFNYGTGTYTFNPINTATPTSLANNHPNLSLNGYVGGLMVTDKPAAPTPQYTQPYVVTNIGDNPGQVGIFLPGASSEMLAFFNVESRNAPSGAMSAASYLFGGLDVENVSVSGLNTARGAYVNPSNFAARAAAIYNNGANTPISARTGEDYSGPVGYADQQMVTAESVGANTASFLTSISSVPVTPCACESTKWGFWSAYNGLKDSSGNLVFEDQGNLLLWVAGVPTSLANLPATGTATYTGHAIANIASGGSVGTSYLAAGTFSAAVNFGARNGAITIGGLDGTNYAGTAVWVPSTVTFNGTLTGNVGGRTAALAGSFFQGGPTSLLPPVARWAVRSS